LLIVHNAGSGSPVGIGQTAETQKVPMCLHRLLLACLHVVCKMLVGKFGFSNSSSGGSQAAAERV
jgi:hypothetical protein